MEVKTILEELKKLNEISNEVIDKVSNIRSQDYDNAVKEEKEAFNDYCKARKKLEQVITGGSSEDLNTCKINAEFRLNKWEKARQDLNIITDKMVKNDILRYKRKNESINKESIKEISYELADHVNTVRQVNALKGTMNPENKETEELNNKAKRSNQLFAKWKQSKNIQETKEKSEIVASFKDDNLHQIVKTPSGLYYNRYEIDEDGNAKSVYGGVKNLPTALAAMKQRCPEAEEVK